jgi:hypothetical protein
MHNEPDLSDFFIIAFVAVVFIAGCIGVFKFMRAGKKK